MECPSSEGRVEGEIRRKELVAVLSPFPQSSVEVSRLAHGHMDRETAMGMGVCGHPGGRGQVHLGNQVWRRQSQVVEWEDSGVITVPSVLFAGRV